MPKRRCLGIQAKKWEIQPESFTSARFKIRILRAFLGVTGKCLNGLRTRNYSGWGVLKGKVGKAMHQKKCVVHHFWCTLPPKRHPYLSPFLNWFFKVEQKTKAAATGPSQGKYVVDYIELLFLRRIILETAEVETPN